MTTIDFLFVCVEDTHGNRDWDTIADTSDVPQIIGILKDVDGRYLQFDDCASQLKRWCKKNNLKYYEKTITQEIDIDLK